MIRKWVKVMVKVKLTVFHLIRHFFLLVEQMLTVHIFHVEISRLDIPHRANSAFDKITSYQFLTYKYI